MSATSVGVAPSGPCLRSKDRYGSWVGGRYNCVIPLLSRSMSSALERWGSWWITIQIDVVYFFLLGALHTLEWFGMNDIIDVKSFSVCWFCCVCVWCLHVMLSVCCQCILSGFAKLSAWIGNKYIVEMSAYEKEMCLRPWTCLLLFWVFFRSVLLSCVIMTLNLTLTLQFDLCLSVLILGMFQLSAAVTDSSSTVVVYQLYLSLVSSWPWTWPWHYSLTSVCLSVVILGMFQLSAAITDSSSTVVVYRVYLSLVSSMLNSLKNGFVSDAVSFVGVHQQRIHQVCHTLSPYCSNTPVWAPLTVVYFLTECHKTHLNWTLVLLGLSSLYAISCWVYIVYCLCHKLAGWSACGVYASPYNWHTWFYIKFAVTCNCCLSFCVIT